MDASTLLLREMFFATEEFIESHGGACTCAACDLMERVAVHISLAELNEAP